MLFEGLLEKIKTDVIKFLLNLNIVVQNQEKEETEKEESDESDDEIDQSNKVDTKKFNKN